MAHRPSALQIEVLTSPVRSPLTSDHHQLAFIPIRRTEPKVFHYKVSHLGNSIIYRR